MSNGSQQYALSTAIAACICFILLAGFASAGNVTFKIKATNPSQSARVMTISRYLPVGIKPETDVVDAGAMAVKYDPKVAAWYVEAEEELQPGQSKDYSVVIKDIWSIPPELVEEMRTHAVALATILATTKHAQTATDGRQEIDAALVELADRQKQYAPGASRIVDHIKAYEMNRDLFARARTKVSELEGLVSSEGIDPGGLMGLPPPLPEKDRDKPVVGNKPLLKMIKVNNPASVERNIPVKVYMPREVLPEDINPGESLVVRYDDEVEACYLTREDVTVGAGQSVEFQVYVTNKWAVEVSRVAALEDRATNLQAVVQAGTMASLITEADAIYKRLEAAKALDQPVELNEDYIAFFHRQTTELDEIEGLIMRLEKILKPSKNQKIFEADILAKVQPPSRRSTWIIIYIILGFLAMVSILFFLRWYGKGADEKMNRQA